MPITEMFVIHYDSSILTIDFITIKRLLGWIVDFDADKQQVVFTR